jgi:prepilin-type N-terminal cleavage/methylation domain-containing protein
MRIIKRLKGQNGFSLMELLISLTILSLVAMFLLPSLTFGYLQLHEAGNQSQAYASVQTNVEQELAKPSVPTSNAITIQFGGQTISVKGSIIEKEEEYGTRGSKAKVKIFIPGR